MDPAIKVILCAVAILVGIYAIGRAVQGLFYLLGFLLVSFIAAFPFIVLMTSIFLAIFCQEPEGGCKSSLIIVTGFVVSAISFVWIIKSKILKKLQLWLKPPPPPTHSYKIDLTSVPPPPPKKAKF